MRLIIVGFLFSLLMVNTMLHADNSTQTKKDRVIILMGPPGSGKGTQAKQIVEKLKIPHISTGDLFRENISKNSELGKKAKEYMNAGKLVPDDLVIEMLSDRIAQPDSLHGYLLDGFPRTIPQAEKLDQLLHGKKLVVISLDVADDTIIKRISGRLLCKKCGNIQNLYFSKPQKEGVCDKCSGELYQRPDDSEKVVKERLKVYHDQTEPLIAFYSKKGVLFTINGEQEADVVAKEIDQVLSR